jgi:hypothetical protein
MEGSSVLPACWCGTSRADPQNATIVREGIPICKSGCLKAYEEQRAQFLKRFEMPSAVAEYA